MATLPTTHTVAVGDKITAADENTYVRDAVSFFSSVPRLHVYASGAQTLSNSTITVLTFDSELYDSDAMHSTSTNTSRLVVTTTGLYSVNVGVTFASNATSWRYLHVRKNAAGSSSGGTSIYQSFFGGLAVSNNNSTATFDISLTRRRLPRGLRVAEQRRQPQHRRRIVRHVRADAMGRDVVTASDGHDSQRCCTEIGQS